MRNGVIITLPHEFKQQPRWNYGMWEVMKYDFGVVTYGITSVKNFVNFRTAIV
jgi:hypothetical protein